MKLNKYVVIALIEQRGISQNQLADKMGVSHGTLSNAINGKRGAGRRFLSGLLRVFPEVTVASLTVRELAAK